MRAGSVDILLVHATETDRKGTPLFCTNPPLSHCSCFTCSFKFIVIWLYLFNHEIVICLFFVRSGFVLWGVSDHVQNLHQPRRTHQEATLQISLPYFMAISCPCLLRAFVCEILSWVCECVCVLFLDSCCTYTRFCHSPDTFKRRVSKNTFFVLVRVVDELW